MKQLLQDIRESASWWLTKSKFAPSLQEQLVQEPHLRAAPNWSVFIGQTCQEKLNRAMRSSQQLNEIWQQIEMLTNGQIDWREFDQTVEAEIWAAAKSLFIGVQAPHVGSYCYRAASMDRAYEIIARLEAQCPDCPGPVYFDVVEFGADEGYDEIIECAICIEQTQTLVPIATIYVGERDA
jgi:hypothetical protein